MQQIWKSLSFIKMDLHLLLHINSRFYYSPYSNVPLPINQTHFSQLIAIWNHLHQVTSNFLIDAIKIFPILLLTVCLPMYLHFFILKMKISRLLIKLRILNLSKHEIIFYNLIFFIKFWRIIVITSSSYSLNKFWCSYLQNCIFNLLYLYSIR
jgi:hypothetical protein